jgi:glycosyltransferase involved in cell wall biosynthesis
MDDHDAFAQSGLLRRGLKRSLRDATAVTGCSSVVLEDLRDHFGLEDGTIVPNGIDLAEVLDPARPPWWPDAGRVVLGLGRVEERKGFDLLLRSVAELAEPAHVVVGGTGHALPALRSLAFDLGLAGRAHFPGRLSRTDVAGAMAHADVFVVPSRLEAFGIVALEAWRGGAPLVMTTHGGARDFVSDGVDALLVDPTDVGALAEAIGGLLADPRRAAALSDAGRRSVTAYGLDRVARDYESVYDIVLGDGRR